MEKEEKIYWGVVLVDNRYTLYISSNPLEDRYKTSDSGDFLPSNGIGMWSYNNETNKVVILDRIRPISCRDWFYLGYYIKEFVGLENLDTSNCRAMDYMFAYCQSIKLDLRTFDVSKVTSMINMFHNYLANELDLSTWDTSSVTRMSGMFYNLLPDTTLLKRIYVGDGWNVDNVTESTRMFYGQKNLPNYYASSTDKTRAHYGERGYLTYKGN